MTALPEAKLANKVKEILGESKMGGLSFSRNSEQGFLEAYSIKDPRRNPITQVFAVLDRRQIETPGSELG